MSLLVMEIPPILLRKIPLKAGIFDPKLLSFAFFHTFIALFSLLYGLFGPLLTLLNTKTSFLVLSGKSLMVKLSGLSVKGWGGVPLISA